MTFISWLIILFAGILYLGFRISEVKEKRKLQLDLPVIAADLEQVIERTATVSNAKLLFDSRYVRVMASSENQDSHLVRFPIMVDKKLETDESNYLSQVFLVQFDKYLTETATYVSWSDKGQMLSVTPRFGELLRHNNQHYLNLEIQFSYSSS